MIISKDIIWKGREERQQKWREKRITICFLRQLFHTGKNVIWDFKNLIKIVNFRKWFLKKCKNRIDLPICKSFIIIKKTSFCGKTFFLKLPLSLLLPLLQVLFRFCFCFYIREKKSPIGFPNLKFSRGIGFNAGVVHLLLIK